MKGIASTIRVVLASRRFFYGVLIFFILESLWIACSAIYPMAFDEDFHVGIIKIYSHHWLPFLSSQPDNAMQFGALQHDPSYLYHYLMSFPYRLLQGLTGNQTVQIIALRCINIALAAVGIVLFRRVLLRVKTSRPLTHTILAVFVLIPIVPLLAGQVNYDNLLFPIVAVLFLLAFRVYEALLLRQIDVRSLLVLAIVCLLASLVKYPFLPIGVAAVLFVLTAAGVMFRHRLADIWPACVQGWRAISRRLQVGLVVALVISFGLFFQRYGLNFIQYHTPVPECNAVLSEAECSAYGPWLRNYEFAQVKGTVNANPFSYTWQWLQSLHYRLFFAVNGPADSFRNYPPLPLPSAAAIVVFVSGMVALALYWRQVFRGRSLLFLLFGAAVLYCAVLWAEDYSQYLETGQPVAINGRYLLPVLLPLAAVFGRAFSMALQQHRSLKPVCAVAIILLFLQGGGLLTFIARSDDAWYWPNSTVAHLNNGARRVLAPVIIEGAKYY